MSESKEKSAKKSDENLPVQIESAHAIRDLPSLAAGLVHEVKNPLAAIHLHLQLLEGYADEIQEDELQNRIKNKVSYIKEEVLNLNHSMQNLLRLVRAEKVRELEGRNLNGIVADVVKFLEPQAKEAGTLLQFDEGETDDRIRMDEAFVKQILINLIINAIQAFDESDLSKGEKEIVVSTGKAEGLNYFRVADNGPGIAPDMQEKIFDTFHSTKKEGSGLGLSIVRHMIASMEGHLELNSEPNKGSRFTVYFRPIEST